MSYEPAHVCAELGIPIKRVPLRGTWGAWVPARELIIVACGLTPEQERSTLAHHVEHALARDQTGCGTGPYADAARATFSLATLLQDRRADRRAARKLLPPDALHGMRIEADLSVMAMRLGVTEHLLRIRLDDLPGEGSPWLLGTSKIAG